MIIRLLQRLVDDESATLAQAVCVSDHLIDVAILEQVNKAAVETLRGRKSSENSSVCGQCNKESADVYVSEGCNDVTCAECMIK